MRYIHIVRLFCLCIKQMTMLRRAWQKAFQLGFILMTTRQRSWPRSVRHVPGVDSVSDFRNDNNAFARQRHQRGFEPGLKEKLEKTIETSYGGVPWFSNACNLECCHSVGLVSFSVRNRSLD